MKLLKIIYSLFLILVAISCKETIVEYIYSKNGFVQLSKNKVEIGEKITAHFVNVDSVKVYSVTLNQKQVTFSQKNDSTVSLIVPFTNVGNDFGNFVFYCWMKTASFPDTVLVSNQISYKYEDLSYEPYIKWNTNEKITQSDSWKYDGFTQNGWSIITENDTIKFIRNYLCHDECSIRETLVFKNNGNNNLPKFLYALYDRNEWMESPINIKITSRCKIIIDEWNDYSTYSGTFSSDDFSWVFWYKK